MKKITMVFIAAMVLLLGVNVVPQKSFAAVDFSGGLLDKLKAAQGLNTVIIRTQLTDNDETTSISLSADGSSDFNHLIRVPLVRVDVASITGYRLKAATGVQLEFCDHTGKVISTISNPDVNGNLSAVSNLNGVAYVQIHNVQSTARDVFEINLYGTLDHNTPSDLVAIKGENKVTLSWKEDVASYMKFRVKRATESGGPYITLAEDLTSKSYIDTQVTEGKTYYYVITSYYLDRESLPSNEVKITFDTSPSVLLTLYISGGLIKEYDLSAVELRDFLDWYDAKDAGTGPAKYAFTKSWNKGPFKARTEYVIFDKILTFDVDEYDPVQ
ncbi:fibronectin type III domain-containing protein [Cohnella xylanilytica]|uniref:Fibronectin type III domain-containing protein n=1 Tax=Cohnella xylanilytica TaxID=557555 RepID=A0A841TNJ5_9BACL|nr:fibronectin type III domain-containing protein [Cohnella xylanilytica]MBB6689896.1 fibronectin type III domain-containing protein [Cohnella xylanilytica]